MIQLPDSNQIPTPNIDHLVLEDDTPVDFLSGKQQRLLVEPLYSAKALPKPFLITANVGLFYTVNGDPVVPDVMLSLGVQRPQDLSQKKNRAYLTWEFGKLPEVCIELVSNQEGDELTLSQESQQQGKTTAKKDLYAQLHIPYYVVFDLRQQIQGQDDMNGSLLRVWSMSGAHYTELTPPEGISTVGQSLWLEDIGLGLTLWEGLFEDITWVWLRWCDQTGKVILTGAEGADAAEQAAQRLERLAEQLRALGVDPDTMP